MRFAPVHSLAFVSVLASSAALSSAHAASPSTDGAIVVRGVGRTRAEGTNDWLPTKVGVPIAASTIVEASGTDPIELRFPDGVEMTMEPGATARFNGSGRLPAENNGWAHGYHVVLRGGEVDVRVPTEPRGQRAFLVSTAAGTLTDWRGSVHVTVVEDTTSAAIYEGALVVGSNGQGFAVFDTTGVFLRKGVNPERSRVIPITPTWSNAVPPGAAAPFAVVRSTETTKVGLAWNPVPGAASYRVELSSDPGMATILQRASTPSPSWVSAEPLPGGRYFARVRAVSAEGIVGGWSRARSLRVVRATYPESAFVAKDGTIILPEHTSVALKDVEGLEVAIQNFEGRDLPPRAGAFWIAAPASIALPDSGSRLVRVRDPQLGVETQLVIGRRELKADVTMCPTRARWPEHPVGVRVLLDDPSRRIDASCEPVTIETTVNLMPVQVEWHHTGAWWWAVVPPQPAPGPWAVRVVAKDRYGAEIGRGHLEVEGPPRPTGATRGNDVTEVRVTH